MAVVDLVARLREHPLMDPVTVHDWRAHENGTPNFAGILNHWTVSNPPAKWPSKGIVSNGRPASGGNPAVPPPLCNILGARGAPEIAVISNRVANHAGRGDPDVLRRCRAGLPPKPKPGPDQSNAGGGAGFIGIEWENRGRPAELFVPVMLDTMYRTNAALCDIFGWDPFVAILQHFLWTPRKIDCDFELPEMSYVEFQENCAAYLTGDDDVTPKDKQDIIEGAAALAIKKLSGTGLATDAEYLTKPVNNLGDISNTLDEILGRLSALEAK